MKKKIITGAVVVVVLCAVLIPRLLGNKQFAQAVSPPVMEAEQPVMGDIRLTTSLIGKIEPSDVVYILSLIHISAEAFASAYIGRLGDGGDGDIIPIMSVYVG